MSAWHREHLDRCCSAPVIAWLIDNGYIADDCGVLDVTAKGRRYIREGVDVRTSRDPRSRAGDDA